MPADFLVAFPSGVFFLPPSALTPARERYLRTPTLSSALRARRDDPGFRSAAPIRLGDDKLRIAPDGDPLSYTSIAAYWHPDPAAPDGLPYLRRDGLRHPEYDDPRSDRQKLRRAMASALEWAAIGFFEKDADADRRAADILRDWFVDPATRMNPHLEYAQFIPGRCAGRGIGIIDTVVLMEAVATLVLLGERAEACAGGGREWFGRYLAWLLESSHGRDERAEANNHGVWYEAQVAVFAWLTGERAILAAAAERAWGHLRAQVAGDGSLPLEMARTRSWFYSVFCLQGFFAVRAAGAAGGLAPPPEADTLLRRATDYLASFAAGALPWPMVMIEPFVPGVFRPLALLAGWAWPEPGGGSTLPAAAERPTMLLDFFAPWRSATS